MSQGACLLSPLTYQVRGLASLTLLVLPADYYAMQAMMQINKLTLLALPADYYVMQAMMQISQVDVTTILR